MKKKVMEKVALENYCYACARSDCRKTRNYLEFRIAETSTTRNQAIMNQRLNFTWARLLTWKQHFWANKYIPSLIP